MTSQAQPQAPVNPEVKDALERLMKNQGAMGYVLVNFDGIPVMKSPDTLPAVQYAALISDLVMKAKQTLKNLYNPGS